MGMVELGIVFIGVGAGIVGLTLFCLLAEAGKSSRYGDNFPKDWGRKP